MSTPSPIHPRLSLLGFLVVGAAPGLAAAAAPNISIQQIHPNLGNATGTSVRVERIRRSSGDKGLINFEVDFINNGGLLELSQLQTSYTPAVLPQAQLDAFANADLLRTENGTFGPWGSQSIKVPDDTVVATSARAVANSSVAQYYLTAGQATTGEDGEDRFYIARVRRKYDRDTQAQQTAFPGWTGVADAVAIVPGATDRVIVAGQVKDSQGVAYLALAQFVDDVDLSPDLSFGIGGTRRIGLPGCGEEIITDLVVTGVGTGQRITATGWGTCAGLHRGFIARFLSNGSLDTSLDGDGILMLANPFGAGVRGKAVRIRDEWVPPGDVMDQRIYVVSEIGTQCDNEVSGDCMVMLTRHRPDGSLDTSFAGTGTKLVTFPQSAGQVPVGLELLPDGKLLVAATRFASSNGQAYVGVTRLNGAGAIDTTFGASGYAMAQFTGRPIAAVDLVVDALGAIFVAGVTLGAGPREVGLLGFTSGGWLWGAHGDRRDDPGSAIHDLMIDAQGKLVVVGGAGAWSQVVRFRGDGRLDWRGILDPGASQRLFWPDDRELPAPFPGALRLDMYVVGNGTPVTVTSGVQEQGFAVRYPWSVTDTSHAWSSGGHHTLREGHRGSESQRYAHDMGIVRFNAGQWVETEGTSTAQNSDFLVWDQPIHAAAGGRVLGCWRTAEDNPAPGQTSAVPMPGGGNMFFIENLSDHTVALYAHLKAGTVSTAACPNACTTYDAYGANWLPGATTCSAWLDPSQNVTVNVGDLLGHAGNSGSSSKPHFHFHLAQSPTGVNNRATSPTWVGVPAYFTETWTDERSKTPANLATVPLAGTASSAPKSLLWYGP